MKQKFIAFYTSAASAVHYPEAGARKGVVRRSARMPEMRMSIKEVELDIRDVKKYAAKEKTASIAPAMPVRLIRPMRVAAAVGPSSDITWGIQAIGADQSDFTGKNIKVAVLDTGIDKKHKAFKNINIIEKDFTGEGNGDDEGHGTHCAGTIFGRDVNGTRIGVARGVEEVLIGKVLGAKGGGSSDQIIHAMQWAIQNGANVISMSLGIDFPGYAKELIEERGVSPDLATSLALEGYRANLKLFESFAAFLKVQSEQEFSQPVVVVAAAGNESRMDINPDYEIGVSPPAIADGIISVAALGRHGTGYRVADFSNSGAILSAPGVDILSAKSGSAGGLIAMDGTSMATPHVAGVTALWMQKLMEGEENVPRRLTTILQGNCKTTGLDGQADHLYGWGMVQAPLN